MKSQEKEKSGGRWLPLLQRMSRELPTFVVWKHLDSALRGVGDVDASVSKSGLESATSLFASISIEQWGASRVVACDHIPSVRLIFAVDAEGGPPIPELDLMHDVLHRFAFPWTDPQKFLSLATITADGVRELRPGARVIVEIMTRSMRVTKSASSDDLSSLWLAVEEDESGAVTAGRRMLPPGSLSSGNQLLDSLRRREWDERAFRQIMLKALQASLSDPAAFKKRILARNPKPCAAARLAKSRLPEAFTSRGIPDLDRDHIVFPG